MLDVIIILQLDDGPIYHIMLHYDSAQRVRQQLSLNRLASRSATVGVTVNMMHVLPAVLCESSFLSVCCLCPAPAEGVEYADLRQQIITLTNIAWLMYDDFQLWTSGTNEACP